METDKKDESKDKKGSKKGESKDTETDKQEDGDSMETEEAAKPAEPEFETKMVTKTRTIKKDVGYQMLFSSAFNPKVLQDAIESELEMALNDRIQYETKDCKNSVEEYVYTLRDKMYAEYNDFVQEDTRSEISAQLEKVEDWLYDEGEDEKKSTYINKLQEIQQLGNPIKLRFEEDMNRSAVVSTLVSVCDKFRSMATSISEIYAHIEQSEKDNVITECDNAISWLNDKQSQQGSLPKYSPPAFLCSEVQKKAEVVERVCQPIMSKPAPKPEPKEDVKMEGEGEANGENGDNAASTPMDEDKPDAKEDEEMPTAPDGKTADID